MIRCTLSLARGRAPVHCPSCGNHLWCPCTRSRRRRKVAEVPGSEGSPRRWAPRWGRLAAGRRRGLRPLPGAGSGWWCSTGCGRWAAWSGGMCRDHRSTGWPARRRRRRHSRWRGRTGGPCCVAWGRGWQEYKDYHNDEMKRMILAMKRQRKWATIMI